MKLLDQSSSKERTGNNNTQANAQATTGSSLKQQPATGGRVSHRMKQHTRRYPQQQSSTSDINVYGRSGKKTGS